MKRLNIKSYLHDIRNPKLDFGDDWTKAEVWDPRVKRPVDTDVTKMISKASNRKYFAHRCLIENLQESYLSYMSILYIEQHNLSHETLDAFYNVFLEEGDKSLGLSESDLPLNFGGQSADGLKILALRDHCRRYPLGTSPPTFDYITAFQAIRSASRTLVFDPLIKASGRSPITKYLGPNGLRNLSRREREKYEKYLKPRKINWAERGNDNELKWKNLRSAVTKLRAAKIPVDSFCYGLL